MGCRILHLIPSLDWGSAELQLARLLPHLGSAGFQQHVTTLRRSECSVDVCSDIAVDTLAAPQRFDLAACLRLRKQVQAIRPDIIHAWRPESWWYAKLVAPSIQRISSHWGRHVTPRWMQWAQSRDHVTHLSAPWLDHPEGRTVDYALPEINAQRIQQQKEASREWLADRLPISPAAHWICSIAPFCRESCLKDAIWVADLLKVVRDDVHLIIGGRGPLCGRLYRFREQARIEDRVHFVHRSDQIQHALQAADGFWATGSGVEGVAAMLEAIIRKIPVVASDVPMHRKYVAPDSTGLLVQLGDRAGWAKQSMRLLDDADHHRLLATAAHQACPASTAACVAGVYAGVYRKKIEARRAA